MLVLFAYALASYFIMPSMDNQAQLSSNNVFPFEFIALLCSAPFLLFVPHQIFEKNQSHVILWFILFFVWTVLATSLTKFGVYYFVYTIFPIFPLYISYTYCRQYGIDKTITTLFFITLLIVSFQYYHIYQVANAFQMAIIGVSYFPLLILPLVLLHPSKILKTISWLLVVFVIISSQKRGGLVALGLGVFVYALCRMIVSQNKKALLAVIAFVIIPIIVFGISHLVSALDSSILERFATLQKDKGSGRFDIWLRVINSIANSSRLEHLTGHGYLSVPDLIGDANLPAHNDFLEIFYDYGLIGLLIYIITWFQLIRISFKLLRQRSAYAPAFNMMVSIYFILSMVSIVLYYFWFTYICIMIGVVVGQNEWKLKKELLTEKNTE